MILVIGYRGQVGSALRSILGTRCTAIDQDEIDLSQPVQMSGVLEKFRPSIVINAAAYTAVDRAESEEALALKVNAEAPGAMAEYCAKTGIPFVHYSTDYVFPGTGSRPWVETDPTGPLNAYGRTKLAGEKAVVRAGGKHLIFRTSWVFDALGSNFLRAMLKLGRERETLRVVSDQIGAPTYAPHLAQATLKALDAASVRTPFPSGVYHLSQAGETSWHQFAQAIFREASDRGIQLSVKSVEAISTTDYPTPAKRPLNSRLNCRKAHETLGVSLPDWQSGLKECMELVR